MISELERISEIFKRFPKFQNEMKFKRPPIGDIPAAHIVLKLNFAIDINRIAKHDDKLKDFSCNTASDQTYELIARAFVELN